MIIKNSRGLVFVFELPLQDRARAGLLFHPYSHPFARHVRIWQVCRISARVVLGLWIYFYLTRRILRVRWYQLLLSMHHCSATDTAFFGAATTFRLLLNWKQNKTRALYYNCGDRKWDVEGVKPLVQVCSMVSAYSWLGIGGQTNRVQLSDLTQENISVPSVYLCIRNMNHFLGYKII